MHASSLNFPKSFPRLALAALASFLAAGVALAQNTAPSLNANAKGCEVFVEDFREQVSFRYGNGNVELVARLSTTAPGQVIGAGGYFSFEEKSFVNEFDSQGQLANTTRFEGRNTEFVQGRFVDGAFEVPFKKSWKNFQFGEGERTVSEFAYFVDVNEGGASKRLWLKAGDWNFTGFDVAEDRYFYSNPVSLYGYTTARYLWRDSGSPLFDARKACLGE